MDKKATLTAMSLLPPAPAHPQPLPSLPLRAPSMQTRIILAMAGAICKTWTTYATKTTVLNPHHLEAALHAREDRPLISICNHAATLDDPILFGTLPWRTLLDPRSMRWSLAAREICFTNAWTSWFFSTGQVIPIVRGMGIHQPAMSTAIALLNDNRWVHVFPEARVNQTPDMIRFKWGVARLIVESKRPPIVLPFFHRGMEKMVPLSHHIPKPNTRVVIGYGQPIDFGFIHHSHDTHANHNHTSSSPSPSRSPSVASQPVFDPAGSALFHEIHNQGLTESDTRIRITSFLQNRVESLRHLVDDVYHQQH